MREYAMPAHRTRKDAPENSGSTKQRSMYNPPMLVRFHEQHVVDARCCSMREIHDPPVEEIAPHRDLNRDLG
jgi:hypothetical protein